MTIGKQINDFINSRAQREQIIICVLIMVVFLLAWHVSLRSVEKNSIYIYLVLITFLYFLDTFLKKIRYPERLQKKYVEPPNENSLACCLWVIFIDVAHMFISLVNLLLCFSIGLFVFERGQSVTNWWPDAFFLTLSSTGIGGITNSIPVTFWGKIFSICSGCIGLIILTLFTAVWLKAFERIFRFLGE